MGDNSVEGNAEEILKYLSGMPSLQAVVLAGNDFYDRKRMKALFQQKFKEIGKGGVIKSYVLQFIKLDTDWFSRATKWVVEWFMYCTV